MPSKIATKCSKCGKTIAGNVGGSLTGWLFRQAECNCELAGIKSKYPTTMQEKTVQSAVKLVVPRADDADGSVFEERYQIISLLGAGGMGCVYHVLDQQTGTERALKLMAPDSQDDSQLAKRLEHEAAAARSLAHPNIVAVQENGKTSGGRSYFLMDYIPGSTLGELLDLSGAMPSERALDIAIQIVSALVHAHEHGVVHRDLKPSNVLISKLVDGRDAVKIVDFGIAQISNTHGVDKTNLTQTGELIGSPLYMSPEQCRGDQLDARADIYSFGCMFFQCLTGRPPFDGDNPVRILLKHIGERAPVVPKELRLKPAFNQIIQRCLAKNPAERYQSAADLLHDLELVRGNKRIAGVKHRWTQPKIKTVALSFIAFLIAGSAFYLALGQIPEPALSPERPEQVNGKTLADLNRAIEADPHSAKAFYERGYFHERRDERDNAIDDFTSAIKLNGNLALSLYWRAEMYMMQSHFDKSIEDINQLQILFPKWSGTYHMKARLESVMEKYHDAIADAQKSGRLNFPAVEELGRSYNALGRHQTALDVATVAMRATTDAERLHYLYLDRASTYVAVHQLDDALKDLQKATEIHHKNSQAWAELASVYAAKGELAEAERCIKKTLALDSFPARAHRLEAAMYQAAGLWSKAVESYSTSTSLEPWYADAFLERAQCELAMGDLNSAVLDLRKALSLSPWSPSINSYLALVEDQIGETASAQKHCQAAFALLPDLPIAFVNRARINLNHGEASKALKDSNRAIELDPYLPDAYDTRAVALRALNKPADADQDQKTANTLGWKKFDQPLKIATTINGAPEPIEISRPSTAPIKPTN